LKDFIKRGNYKLENYKKKRNYKKWWVILIIIFVGIISGFFIYKSSVDDYEIVEEVKESLQFGYDRITVEAITEKKINKEQVESLLKDIANDVEKPVDGRMKTRNKQEENHGI